MANGGGGSRGLSLPSRALVLSCAGALGALGVASVAGADAIVSSDLQDNGLLEIRVVERAGADGNHGLIVEPFDIVNIFNQSVTRGTRVRQRGFGDPAIRGATGVDCTTNPVFNDVVCRGDPGTVTIVTGDGADRVQLRELGPDAVSGCVAAATRSWAVTVTLGSGDDELTAGFAPTGECTGGGVLERARPMSLTANGGTGDDVLNGTALGSTLNGGGGRDELLGSSRANDTLDGGTGADVISGGSSITNDIDTVTYASRTQSVRVSLNGAADDGETGEGDNVQTSVERVLGGSGSDALSGFGGSQSLVGNGGADELQGGEGRDTFVGGEGDDFIVSRDGLLEAPDCGRGVRDSAVLDLFDLTVGCEFRDVSPVDDGMPGHALKRPLQRRSDGTVLVDVACPRAARIACAGRLTLRRPTGRAVLASARYRVGLGRTVSVKLRLRASLPGRVRVETLEQGVSKKGPRSSSYLLPVR